MSEQSREEIVANVLRDMEEMRAKRAKYIRSIERARWIKNFLASLVGFLIIVAAGAFYGYMLFFA